MESPYFVMNHDCEEENRIARQFYKRGYDEGYAAGVIATSEKMKNMTDEELLGWKSDLLRNDRILEMLRGNKKE
ncbi:MAG: hypothetical protein J6T99_07750 [Oscillospiraceae bacterium]|nr:hypothetical protein [Oscillospiraceae bacterium]